MSHRMEKMLISFALAIMFLLLFADALLFPAQPVDGDWATIGLNKPTAPNATSTLPTLPTLPATAWQGIADRIGAEDRGYKARLEIEDKDRLKAEQELIMQKKLFGISIGLILLGLFVVWRWLKNPPILDNGPW